MGRSKRRDAIMKCATCQEKECRNGKHCSGVAEDIEYTGKDLDCMQVAAAIEGQYYMQKTRLEELILFARQMGYQKLGIAFCIGLASEAATITRILEKDFEVYSTCCKVCGIPKEKYGLEKIHPEKFEVTCNPKGQAFLLAKKQTELNIIVGLCMGHDIIFTRNSEAPVTTLIVKDRVLAHNPAGAIYSGYYLRKKFNMED
jgi:uncharacterized metal-binding protein